MASIEEYVLTLRDMAGEVSSHLNDAKDIATLRLVNKSFAAVFYDFLKIKSAAFNNLLSMGKLHYFVSNGHISAARDCFDKIFSDLYKYWSDNNTCSKDKDEIKISIQKLLLSAAYKYYIKEQGVIAPITYEKKISYLRGIFGTTFNEKNKSYFTKIYDNDQSLLRQMAANKEQDKFESQFVFYNNVAFDSYNSYSYIRDYNLVIDPKLFKIPSYNNFLLVKLLNSPDPVNFPDSPVRKSYDSFSIYKGGFPMGLALGIFRINIFKNHLVNLGIAANEHNISLLFGYTAGLIISTIDMLPAETKSKFRTREEMIEIIIPKVFHGDFYKFVGMNPAAVTLKFGERDIDFTSARDEVVANINMVYLAAIKNIGVSRFKICYDPVKLLEAAEFVKSGESDEFKRDKVGVLLRNHESLNFSLLFPLKEENIIDFIYSDTIVYSFEGTTSLFLGGVLSDKTYERILYGVIKGTIIHRYRLQNILEFLILSYYKATYYPHSEKSAVILRIVKSAVVAENAAKLFTTNSIKRIIKTLMDAGEIEIAEVVKSFKI